MTDKTELTISEVQNKLKEVGLDKFIDFEFYLKAKEGGIGSAFPVAELLGIHPETNAPYYVARRECWGQDEYVIGFPPVAHDKDKIQDCEYLPDHLKFIAKTSKFTTYFGATFFKITFEKDVNGEYYTHLRTYTPTVEDSTICDWILTSMQTFYDLYFAKKLDLENKDK